MMRDLILMGAVAAVGLALIIWNDWRNERLRQARDDAQWAMYASRPDDDEY